MAFVAEQPAIWRMRECDADAAKALADALNVHIVLARILVQRGITDPAAAEKFLNPRLEDLMPPQELPDFDRARKALFAARDQNKLIYIHGDYDVDGVTSTAILYRFLSAKDFGFNVVAHVPHRGKEGYGIHIDTIRKAKQEGADLILTCDCGIGAHEQMELAYELGMKAVITDHHQASAVLPRAEAIVNPTRLDHAGGGRELSGAGIAFLFCLGLAEELGVSRQQYFRNFLDLATLGTVADVMNLRDNNRIIVRHGLPVLRDSKKTGVRALLEVSGLIKPSAPGRPEIQNELNTEDIGWKIGPRINAIGRLADAAVAYRLLITRDEVEARNLAQLLDNTNQERKEMQRLLVEEVKEIIERDGLSDRNVIVVAGEGWPKGIVGIVAGKITEAFRRPSFVLAIHGDIASGSARSIEAFNLHEAIEAHRHLILTGGGHAAAAGVSLRADQIEAFADALHQFAGERLTPEDFLPAIDIDQDIRLEDCSEWGLDLAQQLKLLEPFGEGNPEPLFHARGATLARCTGTKNGTVHRQVFFDTPRGELKMMAFFGEDWWPDFEPLSKLDVIFKLRAGEFRGSPQLDVSIEQARLAEA